MQIFLGRWAATLVALAACLLPVTASAAPPVPTMANWSPGGPVQPAQAVTSTFVLPIFGRPMIVTPFRPPASRYGPGHRGVDLAAFAGSPVLAAGAGVVAFSGRVAGRGVVSIDHPIGVRTTYEPIRPLVKPGDHVSAGQIIGRLDAGHAACVPAVCLHWGARLPDGSYIDPMRLLTGLKVRLLPWKRGG